MVPDISNCIGSPEGYSDWMLQSPTSGCAFKFGYVRQDTNGTSIYPIDKFVIRARISVSATAALAARGLWSNRSDFSVTINGVSAVLATQTYPMAAGLSSWAIGDLYTPLCTPTTDCYSPYCVVGFSDEICNPGEGFFEFDLKGDSLTSFHTSYGGLSSMSFSPLRCVLYQISTGETLLDIEFSLAASDGVVDDDCAPSSSTGGPWMITVNAGSVCADDAATWLTIS